MGVILAALWTLLLVTLGGSLVWWVERRVVSVEEPGIAGRFRAGRAVRPDEGDPWLYHAGPVVALVAVALGAVIVPFGGPLIGADLVIGLFYFIVVVDLFVVALAVSGWGTGSDDAVESCYRAVAQLVAYVVPLGLAILGPIMMARSLSTEDIVWAQDAADLWYVVVQPLGFALYLATGLMQSYRAPFLEPFARPIEGGVRPGYAGWHGVLFSLAGGGLLFIVSAIGAVLYLGGPSGPLFPGWLWMVVKTAGMVALFLALGRLLRPRSTAEMLAFAWKALVPAGLLNVLIVGALILLGVGQGPFGGA